MIRVRWFVGGFAAGVVSLYATVYALVVRYVLFGRR